MVNYWSNKKTGHILFLLKVCCMVEFFLWEILSYPYCLFLTFLSYLETYGRSDTA